MNKVTKTTAAILVAITMIGGAIFSRPTSASASATYKRNKITKVKTANYYSTKNARTYAFKGSAKHLVLKSNHALKNYKTTTWIRTKKTTITKHGKKYLYYYVTNSKNGAKGWVWHKYLKSGMNYQSSKVTSFNGTYQAKKLGKFYKVTGSTKYIKLSQGTKLTSNVKYTVSQKRTIYKKGKAYKYYYVTNLGTKQQGWTWSGYLAKSKKATPAKTASSNGDSADVAGKLNTAQVVSQSVALLNSERAKAGHAAVTVDGTLTQIANTRAVQLLTEFDHYYHGKNGANELAKAAGIYDTYFMTEDLTGVSSSSTDPAADIILGFQGDGHWYDVINPAASKIGIGMAEDPKNSGEYYVAVEMGF